jgi:drug/metabolite transporter (DMT)-like permease
MKVMTRDHAPMVLLVWSATLGLAFAVPGAALAWRWPTPVDLALLVAMGVIATVNQWCYIKGMQIGDAAAMSPIDYTRLVFAAAAGFLLFGELPGPGTIAGAGVVVASTLFITWREHRATRRAEAAG